jgi:hypothetical protein
VTGTTGTQGLQGPMGPQGVAGPVGMTFQGVYSSTTNYAVGDGVIYNGAGYVSLVASNHGNTPDQSPAQWGLFATGTPGRLAQRVRLGRGGCRGRWVRKDRKGIRGRPG